MRSMPVVNGSAHARLSKLSGVALTQCNVDAVQDAMRVLAKETLKDMCNSKEGIKGTLFPEKFLHEYVFVQFACSGRI